MFASVKSFFSSLTNILGVVVFIAFLVAGNYFYSGWHEGKKAIEQVKQVEQANKDLRESIQHVAKINDRYVVENQEIRDAFSSIKPSVSVRHTIERTIDNRALGSYAVGADELYIACENEYRAMAEEASRASATAWALKKGYDVDSVKIEAEKLKKEARKWSN